jgi:hypothetical protein
VRRRALSLGCIAGLTALAIVIGGRFATSSAAVAAGPTIRTIAGTGVAGDAGDGGPALAAEIDHPRGLAFLKDGSLVFSEPFLNIVRRISPAGTITTVAGTGTAGFSGDGGPAANAELNFVHGVAAMADGGFVLSDMFNNRIRRVDAGGTITTVAGTGRQDFGGDGGPATAGIIQLPRGVATTSSGVILIPDSGNNRVRRIARDGTITTVAGIGLVGGDGDGGPATSARLDVPFSVSPLPDGGFLVAERAGNRIRRVGADGTITTVAGTGAAGFSGDGGSATAATLNQPHAVLALPDGGFLIADASNQRVRRVSPSGTITTVAGTGVAGFSGDGPASQAELNYPKALALLPNHRGFVVADSLNHRIRVVAIDLRAPLALEIPVTTLTTRAGHSADFAFSVTRPAAIQLSIARTGEIVGRIRRVARAGASTWPIGAHLRPATYQLLMKATTTDGIVARGRATLTVRA